jgi:low affinity Fe/Cu permease
MTGMATGETFMRLHWARSASKSKVTVNKAKEQHIRAKIALLEKERSTAYDNDELTDSEVRRIAAKLTAEIHALVDSMY